MVDQHRHQQVVSATDWAITVAVRASLTALPAAIGEPPLIVTAADVVDRAAADFNLHLTRAEAAAMLRARLEFRGHAAFGAVVTDAYEEDQE